MISRHVDACVCQRVCTLLQQCAHRQLLDVDTIVVDVDAIAASAKGPERDMSAVDMPAVGRQRALLNMCMHMYTKMWSCALMPFLKHTNMPEEGLEGGMPGAGWEGLLGLGQIAELLLYCHACFFSKRISAHGT